ncbi:MAG: TolC family protein [Legionellaceae bacterium]|nr:TolC family protein [Legionellaceae bacterium]
MGLAIAGPQSNLYRWVDDASTEGTHVAAAHDRLRQAIRNPEYMLRNWIELPISPTSHHRPTLNLSLREAILLALRYNPNIQSAELDRIIQRYQLRLAQNAFELQYALAGTAMVTNSNYSGVGSGSTRSYLASPEFNYKNTYGTQAALKMDNNVAIDGNYNPLLNFSFKQPLLRGFGKNANEASLLNAIDTEWLNKLNLQQAVIDQVTQVITSYRSLVLSGNNLQTQQRQLTEAHHSYTMNEKKIDAGQLEPSANVQQSYQIESLSLMVEQAENDFATTAQNLLQIIGLDPDMRIAVPSDVTLDTIKVPDIDESVALALAHNTQYLALKMGLKADERAYTAAKNQQLWQLDLMGNVQAGTVTGVDRNTVSSRSIYTGNNVAEAASVTLTIPLEDISRRSALISAKIQLEKDRVNLIAAERALITTIKNTITTIASLAKRYALAQRQVELAEQSYALEKKKLESGIASALDVNNTQNQWIQAQMGLISAKIAYLDQLSALQRLLGTTLVEWHIKLRYTG